MLKNKKTIICCLLLSTFFICICPAVVVSSDGTTDPVSLNRHKEKTPALLAAIWDIPALCDNKKNAYIQSLAIVGRYHGQYWSERSGGNSEEGWENRRIYLGLNAGIFKQFTIEVQVSISDGH